MMSTSSVGPVTAAAAATTAAATTTTGPADTRQAILDAAEAEFGRRGFRSTTIGGVAAAAGVSRPLVYRYFGDKETLYRLVVERLLASWHDALVGAATPAAPTTAHRLRAVMAACLEWAGRHSMLRGLLLRDSDLTRRVAGTTLDEGRDRLPALLERVLAEGVDRGDVRADLPPAEMAAVLTDVIVAGAVQTMAAEGAGRATTRTEAMVEVVLHGVVL